MIKCLEQRVLAVTQSDARCVDPLQDAMLCILSHRIYLFYYFRNDGSLSLCLLWLMPILKHYLFFFFRFVFIIYICIVVLQCCLSHLSSVVLYVVLLVLVLYCKDQKWNKNDTYQ